MSVASRWKFGLDRPRKHILWTILSLQEIRRPWRCRHGMNFPSRTPESWFTLLADDLREFHLYIHPPLCLSTCLLVAVYEYRTHTLSLYIHSLATNTRVIALDTKISNMGWLDFRLLQPPISKLALPVTSMLLCVILFPLSQPKNSTISVSCSINVVSSDSKRSLTWAWRKSDRLLMHWFLCTYHMIIQSIHLSLGGW